jgi:rhodanese-related sulfurtransferase
MKIRMLVSTILFVSALLGVLFSAACAPGPTPVPFDLNAALDRYFSSLPDGWGAIAPAALNEQLQSTKPFLVDVRETKEVADAGFIAGSINLPIRTFVKNLDKLPAKGQAIVVVCGSGHRSAMAMQALQMLGYTNVKSLASGFSAWKAANLPFMTGAPPDAKAGSAPEVDQDLLAALDNYLGHLPDGWNTIAPAMVNDLLKTSQPFLLEVRDQKEVAEAGSIPNATNIPIRTLIKNLDKLPPDKGAAIIAECSSGHRSAMTMMSLGMLGYSNVRSLAGGFAAWTKVGLPVSK